MQYKTVAAPVGLIIGIVLVAILLIGGATGLIGDPKPSKERQMITKQGDARGAEKAVAQYSDLTQKESVGGWELDLIQSIPVEEKPGCLAGLFGATSTTTFYNMLVFKKED